MAQLTNLNFAKKAEETIKSLITKDRRGNSIIRLTTSKIRNLLTMSNNLYKELIYNRAPKLSVETMSNIQYLKMRFAYEAGRDNDVRTFVEQARLMACIDEIGDSRDQALLFCKYMESLVAYHKFYGGKDR